MSVAKARSNYLTGVKPYYPESAEPQVEQEDMDKNKEPLKKRSRKICPQQQEDLDC